MTENQISYIVRGCIFNVYNTLGPGLLESACEAALMYEIKRSGLDATNQVALPMIYETVKVDVGYRIDILVEKKVIVEIKSVETILDVHHKQLITYLKLSGLKLGLLVNFNSTNIAKSIYRKVNGLKDEVVAVQFLTERPKLSSNPPINNQALPARYKTESFGGAD